MGGPPELPPTRAFTSQSQRISYNEHIADGRHVLCRVLDPAYSRPLDINNFDNIHGLGFLYIHLQNLLFLGQADGLPAAAKRPRQYTGGGGEDGAASEGDDEGTIGSTHITCAIKLLAGGPGPAQGPAQEQEAKRQKTVCTFSSLGTHSTDGASGGSRDNRRSSTALSDNPGNGSSERAVQRESMGDSQALDSSATDNDLGRNSGSHSDSGCDSDSDSDTAATDAKLRSLQARADPAMLEGNIDDEHEDQNKGIDKNKESGVGSEAQSNTQNGNKEREAKHPLVVKLAPDCRRLLASFRIDALPGLSLKHFLERINKYLMLPILVYVAASFFLHRVFYKNNALQLNQHNVYKLVSAFIRVSEKLLQDKCSSDQAFWKVVGWKTTNKQNFSLEVNAMELSDFNISVDKKVLDRHLGEIKRINQEVSALRSQTFCESQCNDKFETASEHTQSAAALVSSL